MGKKADTTVRGLAIDALALSVPAAPVHGQGQAEERMPTVVHRHRFQIVCIM